MLDRVKLGHKILSFEENNKTSVESVKLGSTLESSRSLSLGGS